MADNPATSGEAAVADAAAAVAKLHLDEVTGEMISKTELKKRQKQREKEAAREKKAAANPKPQAAGNKSAEAAEKELTPNQVCFFLFFFCLFFSLLLCIFPFKKKLSAGLSFHMKKKYKKKKKLPKPLFLRLTVHSHLSTS